METTYTIKSIQDGYIWEFKYDLKGDYISFKIISGTLSLTQKDWLGINFPWYAEDIEKWKAKLKKNFEIKKDVPEITFDLFWKAYPSNPLSKKKKALERWDKLTQADQLKIMIHLPEYIKHKTQQKQFFPYAEVFINERWWDK